MEPNPHIVQSDADRTTAIKTHENRTLRRQESYCQFHVCKLGAFVSYGSVA